MLKKFRKMPQSTRVGIIAIIAIIATAVVSICTTPAKAAETAPTYVYCAGDLVIHPDHTWSCGGSEVLPTPTVTTPAPTTPAPTTPAPTTPAPTTSTTAALNIINNFYFTGYSYWDNTPRNSANISHPVVHTMAGGLGTYDDPITLAVGHTIIGGKDILDFAAGTRFYLPMFQRYFMVEDTCGDGNTPQNGPCHRLDTPGNEAPADAVAWIDGYFGGGSGQGTETGANNCMNNRTQLLTVVYNAPRGLKVVNNGAGKSMYGSSGCTATYGNTVQYAV